MALTKPTLGGTDYPGYIGALFDAINNGNIPFPATQVPSADPNTFDDYEEGTWTPGLAGSVTPGTQTYAGQAGVYTKSARCVDAAGNIGLSAKDGATAGNMRITGLPFTAGGSTGLTYPGTKGYSRNWNLDVAGGYYALELLLAQGTAYIELYEAGDNVVPVSITEADFGASSFLYFAVSYIV